jgi:hypothetical protein
MALMDDERNARNANIEAKGSDGMECFVMKRREFEQLLGPVNELLAEKSKVLFTALLAFLLLLTSVPFLPSSPFS